MAFANERYKVTKHYWHSGILEMIDHFVESLDEAIAHLLDSDCDSAKVYNPEGNVVHHHHKHHHHHHSYA